MTRIKDSFLSYLTLFGSMGTLLCCALPALLVSLGLGAVMAGLASHLPGLIWISEHKNLVFSFAGLMLGLNGLVLWHNRNAPCPVDPQLRDVCMKGRSFSKKVYWISLTIFFVGVYFAFVAVLV